MKDPNLPKVLKTVGVAAWKLPPASLRQMDTHRHEEAQLCGLDAGLAVMETDGGSWLCPPGRCVWIPAGTNHSLRSCGRISGWALHMKAHRCAELPEEPKVLDLSNLLKEVIHRIMEWTASPKVSLAKQHLVSVLQDEIAGASEVGLHLPVPKDPALKKLAVQMSTALDDRSDLAALAHENGLSERSLFRGFQRETGLSPGQWRRQMQVLRSLELLTEGRSVTETSLEVGYESPGAFIRAFRQIIGTTPAAYMQTQR